MNGETIVISEPHNTPLVEFKNLLGTNRVLVKNEVSLPTHTFKDRLAYEMLQPIIEQINKNVSPTKTTFCCISYGNTIYSMAFYCKLLNDQYGEKIVNAIGIVPTNLNDKLLGPNVEGQYVRGIDLVRELSSLCQLIEFDVEANVLSSDEIIEIVKENAETFDNIVDITEGLNVPAYEPIISEVIEEQLEEIPDYIIVPFGAGILCNEIKDYVNKKRISTKVIPVSTGDSESIATMLYGPIWVDTEELLQSGHALSRHSSVDKKGNMRTPYLVYHINDYLILNVIQHLKQQGISSEPSALAGFAMLNELNKIDRDFRPNKHSVLIINTGNGILNFNDVAFKPEHSCKSQLVIDEKMESYVNLCNDRADYYNLDIFRKLNPLAEDDILQITTVQAYFISYIIKTFKPKKILDIGTYKGYSALVMALASENDVSITTLEKSQDYAKKAFSLFRSLRMDKRINIVVNDALEAMKNLLRTQGKESFDLILLDADKEQYVDYYNKSLELLKPSGTLVIDNTLLFGSVVGKKVDGKLNHYASKDGVKAIMRMNNIIKNDNRVFSCLLPISDGFTLVTKNSQNNL